MSQTIVCPKVSSLEGILTWFFDNPGKGTSMRSFLLCMNSYVTSGEVWNIIRDRITENSDSYVESDWQTRGELVFLVTWVELAFSRDFTLYVRCRQNTVQTKEPRLLKPLLQLCRELPPFLGNRLKLLILKNSTPSMTSIKIPQMRRRSDESDKTKYKTSQRPFQFSFLAADPRRIAEQITMYHCSIFKKLDPAELLGLAYQKEDSTFSQSHKSFNHMANSITSEIVTTHDLEPRVKLLTNCIATADHLFKLGNFMGLMAVLASLNQHVVTRLKKTWSNISSKDSKLFESLNAVMDYKQSYKAYRAILSNTRLPVVPYVGLFTRDFTFLEDGNENFVDGEINFDKICMCGSILQDIRFFQTSNYDFELSDTVQQYLRFAPVLSEDDQYPNSQFCEK